MSANNWSICPNCRMVKTKKVELAEKNAEKKYGKIPADAYKALMKEVDDLRKEIEGEDELTMREDYELGVDSEGTFEAIYRASCQKCNFAFLFKHTCDAHNQEQEP